MIEDEKLGIKVAENTNEAFWTETKQKCLEAIDAEERNLKINKAMIKLCEEQLK
jgi:hypothetical protein